MAIYFNREVLGLVFGTTLLSWVSDFSLVLIPTAAYFCCSLSHDVRLSGGHHAHSRRHPLRCHSFFAGVSRSELVRQVVLDVVLHLLFCAVVVPEVSLLLDTLLYLTDHRHLSRVRQLHLRRLVAELLIDRPFHALDAPVHKGFKVVTIEIERLLVDGMVALGLQAIILLKVEDLLDIDQNLHQPVFAELPSVKLPLQVEPSAVQVDQRVENLRLEHARRHGSRVVSRDVDAESDYRILVDALLAKIYTFPVGERRSHILRQWVRRHEVHVNWCIFLQHLVLQQQGLHTYL